MSYIQAYGPDRTTSGGGGGGQTLAWQIDEATVANYSVGSTVLTLTQTPVGNSSIVLRLNNGVLNYGTDWTLSGSDIVIQFNKALDGADHIFTAQYPYNA